MTGRAGMRPEPEGGRRRKGPRTSSVVLPLLRPVVPRWLGAPRAGCGTSASRPGSGPGRSPPSRPGRRAAAAGARARAGTARRPACPRRPRRRAARRGAAEDGVDTGPRRPGDVVVVGDRQAPVHRVVPPQLPTRPSTRHPHPRRRARRTAPAGACASSPTTGPGRAHVVAAGRTSRRPATGRARRRDGSAAPPRRTAASVRRSTVHGSMRPCGPAVGRGTAR
ncbi:MAG: hypothetical protein JWN08_2383 [Frankiales bacterium]|nr:hypothetical protein [Frankiales bacterium]